MDEANPQGMPRPRIKTTHKGYSDEPTPSRNRPMIPIHNKAKQRPMIAVGEGNDPKGMERPDIPTYGQAGGAPYDQASDPDDFAPFKKGERFDGPPGAGKYTAF